MKRAGLMCLAVLLQVAQPLMQPSAHSLPQQSSSQPPATPQKPDPRKARDAFERGDKAEQEGRWSEAFAFFSEAAELAPGTADYVARRERARFHVVQQHLDRAELAHVSGNAEAARAEVLEALALDPKNEQALAKLAQLERRGLRTMTRVLDYEARPVQLQPLPGKQSFDVTGITAIVYEEVAKAFGLRATFDQDLSSKTFRFRIADVDFAEAVALLGEVTNTFIRPLESRLFLVVNDTPEKRKQYSPVITRAIELPSAATSEQINEIRQVVREIAGITNPQIDTRTRQLVLRDSPENVALAIELIQELEQARGEILLEVLALAVDRDASRRLGITPPSSARTFTLSPSDVREAQGSAEGLLRVITRIFGPSGSTAGLSQQQLLSLATSGGGVQALIPPLLAFGGGKTIFLGTLPGASADFADSLAVIRSARRVLLRAQDGTTATFFSGDRFPISLATLTPSIGSQTTVLPGISRQAIRVGDEPVWIASADFDITNGPDLIVANRSSNTLSVLLNSGSGAFPTASEIPTGAGPSFVLVAEFEGNGRPDFAVTESDDNTVGVLLGNGDGTFTRSATLATDNLPVALAQGDFDGNGRVDLIVVNADSNNIQFFPGNGDGTFGSPTSISVGTTPVSIAAGDWNEDGRRDVAVVNQGTNSVSILLGTGTGNFTLAPELAAGEQPTSIATADFDNDGNLDLVVTNRTDGTLSVFLGNGDGTFDAAQIFAAGPQPEHVVAADFTRDGRVDLLIASGFARSLSLLLGIGDGRFVTGVDLGADAEAFSLTAADFNSDGNLDAASANPSADTITLYLNNVSTAGGTSALPSAVSQAYPTAVFEDLGIKVKITPRLHPNAEVTLQVQLEFRELGNTSFNNIPIISNRSLEQVVRLRENETTLLTNVLARDENRSGTGWPALSRSPGLGYLLSRKDLLSGNFDLVIAITPRRVRLAPRRDRSIFAGRKDVPSATTTNPPQ